MNLGMVNTCYLCSLLYVLVCVLCPISAYVAPYDLDVIPATLPPVAIAANYNKHVPRKIWMAVKDIKDNLPGHIQAFLKKNSLWEANICDNDCKDKFMNSTFAGTDAIHSPYYVNTYYLVTFEQGRVYSGHITWFVLLSTSLPKPIFGGMQCCILTAACTSMTTVTSGNLLTRYKIS